MTNLSRIDQRRRNTKNQDGINDAWIAQALPAWITDISPVNARALKAAPHNFAPFKPHARSAHHQLKEAISEHWSTQNAVDALLDNLTDVYAFAEPLLKNALSEHYGDIDVRNTYLRLYAAVGLPWWVHDFKGGTKVRTVSLLNAALHNFSDDETFSDFAFLDAPDPRGQMKTLHINHRITGAPLTAQAFKAICRDLDIGARYQQALRQALGFGSPQVANNVRTAVIASQKAALKAAAHLALLNKHIDAHAHRLILDLVHGRQDLRLDGKPVSYYNLAMMETVLAGILLITTDPGPGGSPGRLIAYVPHDNQHPLKEYPSPAEFMAELTRQLQEEKPADGQSSGGFVYQQFFSQFVPHKERGHFFASLNQRLSTVKWHQRDRQAGGPVWRDTPVDNPNLSFSVQAITDDYQNRSPDPAHDDLWQYLLRVRLNKIVNDARDLAISTQDADRMARWAWWDNLEKMLSDIFNVALFVVTPFVPVLGELMLAYTAYQLTDEVFEGVVDWAEGQTTEAAGHVLGIVENLVQFGIFGSAAELGKSLSSPFIDAMKPVQLPDGSQRLWHPDLTPYQQHNLSLPADSTPDAWGLHRHQGKSILPHEGKLLEVEREPSGRMRVIHPRRPDAYRPQVTHNGLGAFVHEGEQPRAWSEHQLMRRLGHSVERFSDGELEQIRTISGTDHDALRRMYVESEAPPPLLADALKRFEAYEDVARLEEQIRSGLPLTPDPASAWFEQTVTELPGWPEDKALRALHQSSASAQDRLYGNPEALASDILSISLADVMAGQLPERVVAFLDEPELAVMLGPDVPPVHRAQALRDQLADFVEGDMDRLAKRTYRAREKNRDPQVRLLRDAFPELPSSISQTLLANATGAERFKMLSEKRLPLRIKNQARELNFEVRAVRATESLYGHSGLTADTERLVLNTLRLHSDVFTDLRVDIRDGSPHGRLRCSVGAQSATRVRTLVSSGGRNKYEVFDEDNRLYGASSLYESLLRAMPQDQRNALGFQLGQGKALKHWFKQILVTPDVRRTALAELPIRSQRDRITTLLLQGGGLSKDGSASLDRRVRDLYPTFSAEEATRFVEALTAQGDPLTALSALEDELDDLRVTLNQWRYQQPDIWGPDPQGFRDGGGRHIAERLIECFERRSLVFDERSLHPHGGYRLDLSVELSSVNLETWWKQKPDLKRFLDKVSILNLDNTRFSSEPGGLLKDFAHLDELSARGCQLTEIPQGITAMHVLSTLRLNDNHIRLTPQSVEQLSRLTYLKTLRLDHNPLGALPDIGRMPGLMIVSLRGTGIDTWPRGTFAKPRPRGFFLDLQDNPLARIPDVLPGSNDAFVVARTRLDAQALSDVNRLAYEDLRRSVGLSPRHAYPPATDNDLVFWPVTDDSEWWTPSPGLGRYRGEAWGDLADEPDSAGFFTVIRGLTQSADYRAGGEFRTDLAKRVWRMIDAADMDAELRNRLFTMASSPVNCADAGAQLFNNMGLEVLASEARSLSTSPQMLERQLVTLARSAARLDHVNEIARADMQERMASGLTPDEVEVYLAYQTGLARRLDLPWQSRSMLHRPVAGVSESMIDHAYGAVLSLEYGDGLVNQMLEQRFWVEYLQATHPRAFEENTELYTVVKAGLLADLRQTQNERAHTRHRTDEYKNQLEEKLKELARQLPVPESVVLTGKEMTDEVYNRLINDLFEDEKELARRLTRMALRMAGH